MQPISESPEELKKNGPHEGVAASVVEAQVLDGDSRKVLGELLQALQAMRAGDFSIRMPAIGAGLEGRIADTFNDIVAANQQVANQLEIVGQVVGREGRTRKRVRLGMSRGAWGEMETSINTLIDDLLWPIAEVTRAIAAVAQGNLLQTVRLDVDGRPLMGEFLAYYHSHHSQESAKAARPVNRARFGVSRHSRGSEPPASDSGI